MVNTITKDDLAQLPREEFAGRIIVVLNQSDAKKACDYLSAADVIGFDTETRPAFRKGESNKVALMQLSTDDTCFLFRLNAIGICDCLTDLLMNTTVKKIGLSLRDDFAAIRKREDMNPTNFIDLQPFVTQYGIDDNSLSRIYGILFGKRISKGQRLSNWENDVLSPAQQQYAALDAWACLRIYRHILHYPMVVNTPLLSPAAKGE